MSLQSPLTSCGVMEALLSATIAISARVETDDFRKEFLKTPKCLSGENFVCPTNRKDSSMNSSFLFSTLQARY